MLTVPTTAVLHSSAGPYVLELTDGFHFKKQSDGEPVGWCSLAPRSDYAFLSDEEFTAGRTAVVRSLLELNPLFSTPAGQRLWEAAARRNLQGELNR